MKTIKLKESKNILSTMIQLIENNTSTVEAHDYILIANCYYMLENYKESTKYLTKATNLDPDDAYSYCSLAQSLISEGKYVDASEALSKSGILNKKFNVKNPYDHIAIWIEFARTNLYIKNKDIENIYLNINDLKNMDIKGFSISYKYLMIYYLYFAISDLDKGFEWYKKHVEYLKHPSFGITSIYCQNAWKDDRYIDLLKEMKLYDYWKDIL